MTSTVVADVVRDVVGDVWRRRGSGSRTCGGTGLHSKANISQSGFKTRVN